MKGVIYNMKKSVIILVVLSFLFISSNALGEPEIKYQSGKIIKYKSMEPFLTFSYLELIYPQSENVLYDRQNGEVMGYIVNFAMKGKENLPLQFTILLIQSGRNISEVIDIYLEDLNKYITNASYHIFSTFINAEGEMSG